MYLFGLVVSMLSMSAVCGISALQGDLSLIYLSLVLFILNLASATQVYIFIPQPSLCYTGIHTVPCLCYTGIHLQPCLCCTLHSYIYCTVSLLHRYTSSTLSLQLLHRKHTSSTQPLCYTGIHPHPLPIIYLLFCPGYFC